LPAGHGVRRQPARHPPGQPDGVQGRRVTQLWGAAHLFASIDGLRRAQGEALAALGFGPTECPYGIQASGPNWRLRDYGAPDGAPSMLIVPAPIKRPYLWDLAPSVSAVRFCLRHGLHVYLLEWMPPSSQDGAAGLAEYADQAIAEVIAVISASYGPPWLMGHSLGGTLAALFAALEPESACGLVLLSAPLCFQPGVSRFRDALVALTPSSLAGMETVPGSLLSQLSALASPQTFVWSRLLDTMLSSADPQACDLHARVERWALDEVPLPGRLVDQILQWLYRENRFCGRTLQIRERVVEPSSLRRPVLVVINTADEIAPPASVRPFVEALPGRDVHVVEYPGEIGVGLQHLGILVGRHAYRQIWPEIMSWLRARTGASRASEGRRHRSQRMRR
jgi:polyhydroxyalkanoate synthase